MSLAGRVLVVASLCVACNGTHAAAAPAARPAAAPRFLKGQLHAHSDRSGDSQTPAADVARWYAARGYDFIVLTDHDYVTPPPSDPPLLVLRGVELTQNLRTCDPPPEPGLACLLHVNALLIDTPSDPAITWPNPAPASRLDLYGRAVDRARALGGLAQINHPNFHYAADGALLAELGRRGALLLEVANEAVDSANAGDATHPSTEALWDDTLGRGVTLWAVATDDAHHYEDADAVRARGETAHTGDRGFVMVRAQRERGSIIDALRRGDFYASNGVLLEDVRTSADGLEVVVDARSPGDQMVRCIGPRGQTLATHRARRARCVLGEAPYVRAVVEDARGRRAWTQPVRSSR